MNGSRQNVSVNIPVTGTEESFNQWHTYVELDPFYITLPAGEATLRLECQVGEGPNLDYMTIERTDEPEPEDPLLQKLSAEHPVQILAKDYKDKDPSVGTETNDGKVSIAWWQENRWIEYLLEVPEAGTYSLTLLAAHNLDHTVTDFLEVTVGDGQPMAIAGSLPAAGGWYAFQDFGPFPLELPAGTVTLRLKNTSSDGVNLDGFRLEKQPDAQTAGAAKTALAAASAPAAAQRDGKIMLADVYHDPSLMEAFIDQLTDEELIYLSGGHYALTTSSCESFGDLLAYGIPPAATADGPAGLRQHAYMRSTGFPCESLLACTWNTDLIYRVAAAMGEECIRANTDLLLTPGLNIHRNPLCGRNFEYFSEDPLLTGEHKLRIQFTEHELNLNWIRFVREDPIQPPDPIDTAGLQAAITRGKAALSGNTYARDDYYQLTQCIEDAEALLDSDDQSQIDAGADALQDLLDNLQPIPAGDLDQNGSVTITDVMHLCRVIARKTGGQDPDAWELHIGDLDRNQSISISDVMKLCRILASK